MRNNTIHTTLGCVALAFCHATGFGQTPAPATQAPAPAAPPSAFDEWAKHVKNPTDWFSWGGDFRWRDEYHNNVNMGIGPYDTWNYMRFRTRLWTTLKANENIQLNARLAWEARYFFEPDPPIPLTTTTHPNFSKSAGVVDELIVDNLNLKLTNLFKIPAGLMVGRQDYLTGPGSGWWLMDGTPMDGSRTYYLDSGRVQFQVPEIKTSFNAIGVIQQAESTDWLRINPYEYRDYVTEQDQRACILYASNKSVKNTLLDAYFIYDDDQQVLINGDQGNIFAFGFRAQYTPTPHWKLSGEIMPEFGTHRNYSLGPLTQTYVENYNALGAIAQVDYLFNDSWKNTAHVAYEYLSGDDPNTTAYERADLLWGHYPRFSELMIYNRTTGPRVGDYGNFNRFNIGWVVQPLRKLKLTADYHALWAVERFEWQRYGNALYSSGGGFRGQLAVAVAEYSFNPYIKGHLRAEFFWPGDFYDGTPASTVTETFLRAEMYFTF